VTTYYNILLHKLRPIHLLFLVHW